MLPTIAWQGDDLVMIDQRKLPAQEIYVTCKTVNDVAKAITTMVIRGAPAIGVAAAYGIALEADRLRHASAGEFTSGMNAHIAKPINPSELYATVAETNYYKSSTKYNRNRK